MMYSQQEILTRLRFLKPELQEQCGVQHIALFGSFARNEAGEGSDVDIFVVLRAPKAAWLAQIYDRVEEALGTHVDIVCDGAHLRDSFRAHIMAEALNV